MSIAFDLRRVTVALAGLIAGMTSALLLLR